MYDFYTRNIFVSTMTYLKRVSKVYYTLIDYFDNYINNSKSFLVLISEFKSIHPSLEASSFVDVVVKPHFIFPAHLTRKSTLKISLLSQSLDFAEDTTL